MFRLLPSVWARLKPQIFLVAIRAFQLALLLPLPFFCLMAIDAESGSCAGIAWKAACNLVVTGGVAGLVWQSVQASCGAFSGFCGFDW